mmetsp:Transcript_435/g.567  ORF Transcript_435/g.567 Transcript_435/m.567 type:complete len:276 (-) Transcript_435:77-904(-)
MGKAAILLGLLLLLSRPKGVLSYNVLNGYKVLHYRKNGALELVSSSDTVTKPINLADIVEGEELQLRKPNSEFELNLGRCIDALRNDFPHFFDRELEWDIYTNDIEINDPSGVQLQGLAAYKQSFAMIRLFRRVMVDSVELTYRLRYDFHRQIIVVNWYSSWTARGTSRPLAHVDAVSHFHLNQKGLIYRHDIEKIIVNSEKLKPPFGTGWLSLRAHLLAGLDGRIPAGAHCSQQLSLLHPTLRRFFSFEDQSKGVLLPILVETTRQQTSYNRVV